MKERKDGLIHLKEIIASIFTRQNLTFNPDDMRIWQVWDEMVGDAVSTKVRPAWFRDGRLRVEVSDPIWLQELEFAREDLREKLNKRLGREAIKKIEFRVRKR